MAETTTTHLRKAEKLMLKFKKQLKRADLDYTVQASISSVDPSNIRFAAQIAPPAAGLEPVTFIAATGDELIEKIQNAIKNIDYTEVEKAFHAAQIEACQRTINFHNERIAELSLPPVTEETASEEGPSADDSAEADEEK